MIEGENKMLKNEEYTKKILTCAEPGCGRKFEFGVDEQKLFAERGLQFEPTRCWPCRKRRKLEREKKGHD